MVLTATFLTEAGALSTANTTLTLDPPSPRIVLTEVLADCLGAEPACEWIEITNTGTKTGNLEGYVFRDDGGEVLFGPAELSPGEAVLVVSESFVQGATDTKIPPGARVIQVSKLGKTGLSNTGEQLTLTEPGGVVVSTIPALPSKPGMSLSLQKTGGYALASPTPCAPNF